MSGQTGRGLEPLPVSCLGAAFGRLQILERSQRAVHGKVAVVDEQFAAHPIGVEAKIDLIARREIACL